MEAEEKQVAEDTQQEQESAQEPKQELKDSHGQVGISKAKYQREMEERDSKIQELTKALEDAQGHGKTADEQIANLTRDLEDFKAKLANEKTDAALSAAGCLNVKAAKAVLADYDGDIEKLASDCPYLFKRQQAASGLKPEGVATTHDELVRKAREAAGTTRYYKKG